MLSFYNLNYRVSLLYALFECIISQHKLHERMIFEILTRNITPITMSLCTFLDIVIKGEIASIITMPKNGFQ
jgi:hypothetical protein